MLVGGCYLGLVGLVLAAVVEYRLYGPVDAVLVCGGPGLALWLTAEHVRRVPGRLDPHLKREAGPLLTLAQVRDKYARQVLQDARIDPNLEEYLVGLSAKTLAWLRDKEHSIREGHELEEHSERLLRRRTVLVGFANGLIDGANEPDARAGGPIERPYAGYPALELKLAAVCRLADDRRLLAS
jgi:hypothetical protein